MRLEKIKLAGFKSFVDPTTVPIPSNLVGIVGPNGCGKSNTIDAVRWVMGESSAKMLRGESMADVIFNGSNTRKPVGTASIELVFDNSEGRAGGQYAQYNQISVKRVVHRDGQSNYFLNGVRCRRRDITDLFLGTGLGPRSYSIIEQGMISRLIEARPEDLRGFLEEAAGISKYKERRRETELRIGRTKENLDRLNDLIEEVRKQLHHLERQAATAEKYKELKQQERRLRAELLALRWQRQDAELQQREAAIAEQETRLQAAIAAQRRLEAEIEQQRELQSESHDGFNEVQGRFYAVGSEIARLEQALRFARESRRQQEQDLEQTEIAWQESSDHQQQDSARLAELLEGLELEEPRLEQLREIEQLGGERLEQAEQAMHAWQDEWDRFNREAQEPAQQAQVERTRINHLEQQDANSERRISRLAEELQRLQDPRLDEEIRELELREGQQQEQLLIDEERLEQLQGAIREVREQGIGRARELDQLRSRLQTQQGRRASLEALQEAALGKKGGGVTEWLGRQGLERAVRLAQRIEVDAGWQRAVETILGFHLQAVCVDDLGRLAEQAATLQRGTLTLFDTGAGWAAAGPVADALLQRVRSPWPLDGLLAGVRIAEGLADALARRAELAAHESFITRDGVWIGPNWLRVTRETDQTAGVLEREAELRGLAGEVERLDAQIEQLAELVEEGRAKLRDAERERDEVQARLNEQHRALSGVRSNLSARRARAEQLRNRHTQLQHEIKELQQQRGQDREELELTRERLHAALDAIENHGERREQLVIRREELRVHLAAVREEVTRQRGEGHAVALRIESMRAARESLQRNLERMEGQLAHLVERRDELRRLIEEAVAPLLEQTEELDRQLARRIEVEAELTRARQQLEEADAGLRGREQRRHQVEQEVQREGNSLNEQRIARQEVLVGCKNLEEQLRESEFDRDQLLAELPEQATESAWDEELARMDARIRRLGPINLAAIDEFKEQSERMIHLESQHRDISESLETLENAIRKIDRETRNRFKETFDKVNTGLQEKFPKLFGGGHAYLQLTGEDLLDTGVTVMARPPGKRNSSIHLLSGGEKALTAVAMVFAIFELNPAPFCMLDEVDAPLDDANVGRFCELVKSMSDRVQFIFITHNKITMEIANQLLGVTMHEPGVSRLVSVDVGEAVKLVGSV